MSAARSIILLGLPGLAIVLGILWYRKRNPHISDPGGSKKKLDDKLIDCDKKLLHSDISVDRKLVIEENFNKTELNKSLPIDIPVGSPIELTDDQLDIEIQKIQSQKSQGRDCSFNRIPIKSLSVGNIESLSEKSELENKTQIDKNSENMAEENQETCSNNKSIEVTNEVCAMNNVIELDMAQSKICEDIEKCDWSEELCELECRTESGENLNTENIRDSAYHSPTENMSSSSPQLSAYSDRHSEHSEDSGKGSSPRSELATTYEFVIPQSCVGKLIGRNGIFVNKIKTLTGANILIKIHPENIKLKICAIDGLQTEIDAALVMIREKFPEKKYPDITLQRVTFAPAVLAPEISPECVSLLLVEGINNDCTVSCVLNGGIVSLQQPLHPSFPSLNLLQCCMAQTYSQNDNPALPMPVAAGMVCACPLDCNWYRAQITNVFEKQVQGINENSEQNSEQQVELRLVDFGNRITTEVSKLRQIRADLMMLPFQAIDCLLANIQPANDSLQWSQEAEECLRQLTFGRLLQAQIYGFLDDVPLVHLYSSIAANQVMFINQELVARGFADWVDTEA